MKITLRKPSRRLKGIAALGLNGVLQTQLMDPLG
jgi:hypothetical protein